MSGLTKVTSKIEEPFDIYTDVWYNVDTNNIPLYVPVGTSDKYRATEGWNVFKNIIEVLWGDANDDGKVDISDYIAVGNTILTGNKE